MIAILAGLMLATSELPLQKEECVIPKDASASEILLNARAMLPADVELTGRLIKRNRRGVVQNEYSYVYTRRAGVTSLEIDGEPYDLSAATNASFIKETAVTPSDIQLEYLWWNDVSFDEMREGETVNGQVCAVIVLKKADRLVRVWVDRKTGALMQAEEECGDDTVRRLWGTRLKKFGDRWMANVMEVETIGSGYRTKITVDTLN